MSEPVRGRLADGREILYFSDGGTPRPPQPPPADPRTLPPRPVPAELRYDTLTDEWVAIAAHRQDRTHLPSAAACPLCPRRGDRIGEIPASDYDVVVFENRFPSFGPALPDAGSPIVPSGPVLPPAPSAPPTWGTTTAAAGRCEVVAFTSAHEGSFGTLSADRVETVIDAWIHRTRELSALPGIRQVFCFENRGEQIGVTLQHPHGQVYAFPFVAPRTRRLLNVAEQRLHATGRHPVGEVLEAEVTDGRRVVYSGQHWTAFVPIAARWPLEVHLVPHRQVPDLPALTDPERGELAIAARTVLAAVDTLYPTPTPYVAAWQQAPAEARDLGWLYWEVTSPRRAAEKLKYLAGSETAMGAFINDVTPERSARQLRTAIATSPLTAQEAGQ